MYFSNRRINIWRELELSWREDQYLQMLKAPDANLSYTIWPEYPFKLLLKKQYRVYDTVSFLFIKTEKTVPSLQFSPGEQSGCWEELAHKCRGSERLKR